MRGKRLVLGFLLAVLLLAGAFPGTALLGRAAIAAPSGPDCIYAEDGRCIPGPVTPEQLGSRQAVQSATAHDGERVLVKRTDAVTPAEFKAKLGKEGFADAEGLLVPGWWSVPVPPGRSAQDVLAQLQRLSDVSTAERDGVRMLHATPNDPYFPTQFYPYPGQWGPQKISAPGAWEFTYGSENVLLAIVDSGIDMSHPDRPSNLQLGRNFSVVPDNADVYDNLGHGTHVAGIAAAAANNGVGIAGLCSGCTVLAVKVADGSSAANSAVANGITYAAEYGAALGKRTVINLSLGGDYSSVEAKAVADAQNMGALVVASAGNSGPGSASYPAALPGVLAVSATDSGDHPAYFSQYGQIAAPGYDIFSTIPGAYGWMSGTSMASPHVVGAAGLILSEFPNLTPSQAGAELKATGDVPAGWNYNYGTGRLNVDRAILRFTSGALPAAFQGAPYSLSLSIAGGGGSKCFSLAAGALPPGLRLTPNGTLVGVPEEVGASTFTVRVADRYGEAVQQDYSLTVSKNTQEPLPYRVYLPLVSGPAQSGDVCRP